MLKNRSGTKSEDMSTRLAKEKPKKANMARLFVSIVIPTYRRRDLLERLLDSLFKLSYPKDKYEVIVVGDASFDDGTEDLVKHTMANAPFKLKYLKCTLQAPSAARNLGIAGARGELIAFTDDDCVVAPNWIDEALPHFSNESVVGVRGQTVIPIPNELSPSYHHATGLMKPGYQTCNIFYKKSVLEEIHGFDERFTFSREDSDLAFTLLERGLTITSAPEAIVEHPVRQGEAWDLIRSAKNGIWDPLLFKKHPRLYREYVGSVFSKSYKVFYLLSGGILASLIFGARLFAAFFFLSYAFFLFWQTSRHLKGVPFSLNNWSTVLVSLLASPYILLWSVAHGNVKYRSFLWH